MPPKSIPRAMTIAGSDSGGGAGIQADLKTFAALGVYGTSVLTAITAQNTLGVFAVHEIPTDIVAAQIDAVITDIGADAVKTGMLASTGIIECVAEQLQRHRVPWLVVDPVMVAKSGDPLLWEDAVDVLRARLVPLASVVTPNIREAEVLAGIKIESDADMRQAAKGIVAMGAGSVIVKGGHREGPATDIFYDGSSFREFSAPRIDTRNTHGTGCTFASAVAAGLARGAGLVDTVALAKEYVTEAIRHSLSVGKGHGPLDHFYNHSYEQVASTPMATFRLPVEVAPKGGSRFQRVIVQAGTGNKYTALPSPLLGMLGIGPEWTESLEMAGGSRQEYSLAEVKLRLNGKERTTICIFGRPESEPVLGTYTLDGFGLTVDVEGRRLVPARLFLGRAGEV